MLNYKSSKKLSHKKVDLVCFGELLWDNLPTGKVAGGAPFNIVNRATALGLTAEVITSVGSDPLGQELVELVSTKGNSTKYIQQHDTLQTSVVNIEVRANGEPQYDIIYPVAWDDVKIDKSVLTLVRNASAFVYSSLGLRDERSREALFQLLESAQLKICDINLRDGHFTKETILRMIEKADILRANESELAMISSWLGLDHLNRKEQMQSLTKRYNYKMVITTLGGEGAVCFKDGQFHVQPVFKVEVKDTVGAGDAFLASFIYSYLCKMPITECMKFACAVGSLTASKHGGTPSISKSEIDTMLNT